MRQKGASINGCPFDDVPLRRCGRHGKAPRPVAPIGSQTTAGNPNNGSPPPRPKPLPFVCT
eukprot:24783-Pyramimonas_sp.AAC.1